MVVPQTAKSSTRSARGDPRLRFHGRRDEAACGVPHDAVVGLMGTDADA
jgi:hypothetical protein